MNKEKLKNLNIGSVNKRTNNREVAQFSLQGNFLDVYDSLSTASRVISFETKKKLPSVKGCINNALNGKFKTAYNCQWRYTDELEGDK